MIGTIYRITPRKGKPVEGRVQGSGGMLGGAGPKKTPLQAAAGLRTLQYAAAEFSMVGTPPPYLWRVFPQFTAQSNGPGIDVDIRGASVEIVDIDTDEPTLGWPREQKKAYWRDNPTARVRVDSLKRGAIFLDIDGRAHRYVRRDGALSGVHHVENLVGTERSQFAGCAEVIPLGRDS